jgi:hypothetical protein
VYVNGLELAIIEYDDMDDVLIAEGKILDWALEVFDFESCASQAYIPAYYKAKNFIK